MIAGSPLRGRRWALGAIPALLLLFLRRRARGSVRGKCGQRGPGKRYLIRKMMETPRPFYSIYSHGFIRAAVCVPYVRVADPGYNVERTLGLARRASELGAAVALFPELG